MGQVLINVKEPLILLMIQNLYQVRDGYNLINHN